MGLILMFVRPVFAQDVQFIVPVGCDYGQDCWVVNYVDVADGDKVSDFECNRKSYDGHNGTDFTLSNIAQMKRGVDVLAAADGKVLRIRDGRVDSLKSPEEMAQIKEQKKECGNGILIDHGNGLNTIYCHLKKGSIVVEHKQGVKAGQKIAQVGLSGVTEFPHLHFGVFWEGSVIDPFTGLTNKDGCAEVKEPLWHKGLPVTYEPVVIFDGGFRSGPPDFGAIARGEENPKQIDLGSAGFVFWAGFFNVEEGDVVDLKITDPDGALFVSRQDSVPETRARQYYFTGRKIGRVQLKPGVYEAEAKIMRGDIVREKRFTIQVD